SIRSDGPSETLEPLAGHDPADALETTESLEAVEVVEPPSKDVPAVAVEEWESEESSAAPEVASASERSVSRAVARPDPDAPRGRA
ncbi:MAG: hypothetical protein Q4P32_10360, partial [Micrococcales bacterium]|nr:hypothetical protein [Micrococcales bacterium]